MHREPCIESLQLAVVDRQEKLQHCSRLQEASDALRAPYRSVSKRSALIMASASLLPRLQAAYRYSFDELMGAVKGAMPKGEMGDGLPSADRITLLERAVTTSLLSLICR